MVTRRMDAIHPAWVADSVLCQFQKSKASSIDKQVGANRCVRPLFLFILIFRCFVEFIVCGNSANSLVNKY